MWLDDFLRSLLKGTWKFVKTLSVLHFHKQTKQTQNRSVRFLFFKIER